MLTSFFVSLPFIKLRYHITLLQLTTIVIHTTFTKLFYVKVICQKIWWRAQPA